ncbi:MAG: M14 family metallopeptidase [Candidatus Phaeomarinobacter sp.]
MPRFGGTDIHDCFSVSYAEARSKFRSFCEAAGFSLEVRENPHAKGRDGEVLSSDVASKGPADAPNVLLVTSGTHGIEGYCGSGCQIALMRDGVFDVLPDQTRVVLVHAVNPYGFSHQRRVNENNIDLNRNFVDHAAPYPDSSAYEAIHPLIAPADYGERPDHWDGEVLNWIGGHGMDAFRQAVSGGQYRCADGLFFGGNSASWSNRMIRDIMENLAVSVRRFRFIDIHTGLGPFGHGEKLGLGNFVAVQRAQKTWGADVTDLGGGESVSAVVAGDIGGAFFEASGAEIDAAGIALEYGTQDPVSVLGALRWDNWLHAHDDPAGPSASAVKEKMRDAFYPDSAEWRESVVDQARSAVTQSINAS